MPRSTAAASARILREAIAGCIHERVSSSSARLVTQPNAIGSLLAGARRIDCTIGYVAPGMRASSCSGRNAGGRKFSYASHGVSTSRARRSGWCPGTAESPSFLSPFRDLGDDSTGLRAQVAGPRARCADDGGEEWQRVEVGLALDRHAVTQRDAIAHAPAQRPPAERGVERHLD